MSSSLKNELSSSDFEVDANELQSHSRVQRVRLIHSLRTGLTVLALVAGISILGLSADTLSVYNATQLPADFLLSLWPEDFDIRPTTSLVAGSAIVTAINVVSLIASKNKFVRGRIVAHSAVSLAAPVVAFIASLVAMVFFYAINASTTVDSFHSWTCRWKSVPMSTRPYFGTLCRESQASLALAVLLVPLELLILVTACFQAIMEKKMEVILHLRDGSAPS
ncbi:hypothetical protein J3458_008971 [Metarhizium acridum]|uniref:Uncharacterized protein n=1 Tax=Metarhizium acridum (strain CQMa 102) TaxID=655827 RepID=E9EEQ5_METAQ|nr:uncharacterized protein MAC_08353 [Metarhizium acridum CQMa 102]EFY85637.1 hypothetical protein MAC_08353 [Metarhizium acridum CQMa 102]KAG8415090.1 hypothetical protein J3458_008971 [Metarhizium acridum]